MVKSQTILTFDSEERSSYSVEHIMSLKQKRRQTAPITFPKHGALNLMSEVLADKGCSTRSSYVDIIRRKCT